MAGCYHPGPIRLPMDQTHNTARPDTLHGWKEIATYLGRSPRAVQRYERELGLPIHRLRTADGQTVYAFREEIDDWRRKIDAMPARDDTDRPVATRPDGEPAATAQTARPTRSKRGLVWTSALAAFALLMGLVATRIWSLTASPGPRPARRTPARVVFVGQTLEALDPTGAVVWSHAFAEDVSGPRTSDRTPDGSNASAIVDLDGDGTLDAIVPVQFALDDEKGQVSDAVYAFDATGGVRWAVRPSVTFGCADERMSGPWRVHYVLVSPGPGRRTVWIAFDDETLWPGFVMEVQPDGRQLVRYAQTGWIMSLAWWTTGSGTYLVAGGMSNEYNRPVVALVDPTAPPAMAPTTSRRFSCSGEPTARPLAFYVLPNNEITESSGRLYSPALVTALGTELKVTVKDGPEVFFMGPDLRVARAMFSDGYWLQHQELERTGRISHTVDACPQLGETQEVRSWTADGGWQTTTLRPDPPGGVTRSGK